MICQLIARFAQRIRLITIIHLTYETNALTDEAKPLMDEADALAPVVQTLDSAIHWINHYPLDNSTGFASVYPLDSDLSVGQRYPSFEQLGPDG